MKLDLVIVQIAIIFLPGLIWARLDARYAMKAKPSDIEFVIRAFLFGITSYVVTFVAFSLFGLPFALIDFSGDQNKLVASREIATQIGWATAVGLCLSILWIYSATYKLLTRLLQTIGATKKFGDEEIWDFTFNSREDWVQYIHFHDIENKIIYCGWVNAFSEAGGLRELVLKDVEVCDSDWKVLRKAPFVYLALPPEKIHIEFPYKTQLDALL